VSIKDLADCKKELGPVMTRTADATFQFEKISDILKAKEACANQRILRQGFCGLQMCHVVSSGPSCCRAKNRGVFIG
jgi:hypothetical protein